MSLVNNSGTRSPFQAMSLTLTEKQTRRTVTTAHRNTLHGGRSWLFSWEIYPIILVSAFLRLYRLDMTPFAGDQSVLYRLAYDAVHKGLIPVTSNSGSIFAMHPPLAIYFFMLPVVLSSDPLWADVMTAFFNITAVLLAYIFTRRYYGRLAATIATSLFATSEASVVFSRFTWQPTLLAPFVLLFLFALFRGVVERRPGWLFPALLLLGVMYQLHEITLVLAVPLFAALLLAPRQTIRLRDVFFALSCLAIIFAPYLIWEANTMFADIHTIFSQARAHAHIDGKALIFYVRFLNSYYYDDRFLATSYYDPAGSASSLVFKLLPLLNWSRQFLLLLLTGGFATAAVIVLRTSRKTSQEDIGCWTSLRANPLRCGLVVLLAWQITPLLLLSRHAATVHLHYLLMILPGPFILIGFFVASMIAWFQQREPGRIWKGLRYGTYTITALMLSIQLVGSTASLVDTSKGINNHIFGYNDLDSLQHAINEADHLALQHHLGRVFISVSIADDSQVAMPFLAEQMRTPATLFDPSRCLVLPHAGAGPVVLLTRSSDSLLPALLRRYAKATLVDQPPLLGTTPFRLYIVTPNPQTTLAPTGKGFAHHLQLLDDQAQLLHSGPTTFVATRWTLLRNESPRAFTSYTYSMRANMNMPGTGDMRTDCLLTSIHAGDQLVVVFPLPSGSALPASMSITSHFLTTAPYTFSQGPLHFETFNMRSASVSLQSEGGSGDVAMSDIANLLTIFF
jgi:4-amino-4-deoxy-L-arabinose transferase-like glycosyltransferase